MLVEFEEILAYCARWEPSDTLKAREAKRITALTVGKWKAQLEGPFWQLKIGKIRRAFKSME